MRAAYPFGREVELPDWRARGTKVMEGDTEVCQVNARRPDRLVKAHLIAAALELLACCKGVLALSQGRRRTGRGTDPTRG